MNKQQQQTTTTTALSLANRLPLNYKLENINKRLKFETFPPELASGNQRTLKISLEVQNLDIAHHVCQTHSISTRILQI